MSDDAGSHTSGQPVGFRSPPAASRFSKGRSGNPRGRPKGRHRQAPYEAVLGQMVTVRDGNEEKRVTAAEAFLLQLAKRGLEGDSIAARAALNALEEARTRHRVENPVISSIEIIVVEIGSVLVALEPLRMATLHDRYRPTGRIRLEPWLVQAALARLGERHLSRKEQKTIFDATRTPHKVQWPDWWTEMGE